MTFDEITQAVKKERERQVNKWGVQKHPNILPGSAPTYSQLAESYKKVNDQLAVDDACSWDTILLEEIYEALESSDDEAIQKELIESIAVIYAWLENYGQEDQS